MKLGLKAGALSPSRFLHSSLALCLGLLPSIAAAQQPPADLSQMSLEDLLNVQVTTVSKKEQTLARTPAAVYVITAEDIERSGATSIPEALRLAPGVDVAQINSSSWAISIRGFNDRISDKLLVLIDGRSVYSPTLSQVLWNVRDVPLDEVERIEVIRGPGGTSWGANAFDGVINVITRSAQETEGGLLTLGGGNQDQVMSGLRYGGRWGRNGAFRISSAYARHGQSVEADGAGLHDAWDLQRLSARSDWSLSQNNSFTLDGELFQSGGAETDLQPVLGPPYSVAANERLALSGGNLLLRWKHTTAGGSEMIFQTFYDRSHQQLQGSAGTTDDTVDGDFQQQARLGSRHEVVWGLSYRIIEEHTKGTQLLAFRQPHHLADVFTGFGQDEITLAPNRLWLTFGTKLEHNDYTGVEAEPEVRALWMPRPRHSLWMAVSRGVRTPNSFEIYGQAAAAAFPGQGGLPALILVQGASGYKSEKVIGYEAGYRTQLNQKLRFDAALFYNSYDDVSSQVPEQPYVASDPPPLHLVLPQLAVNFMDGHSEGVELSANYAPARVWKLSGSYSWLRVVTRPEPAHPDAYATFPPGNNPQNQFQVHSYLSLPRRVDFDTNIYFVSALTSVRSYTRLDLHLAWSPVVRLRLSSGLQNLLAPRHPEFIEILSGNLPAQVTRAFYGKAEWRF